MVVPKLSPFVCFALVFFIVAPEPVRDSPTKLGEPSKAPAVKPLPK